MYTGLLHSHKLFVLLFLIHYVVKLILLLMSRHEQLAKYSKATRIPEMILSFGFLATGIGMLVNTSFTTLLIIKLVCVFASIPLAIIGFKKGNKVLAFVAVFLIIMSYGLAEMNKKASKGKAIDTSGVSNPIEAGLLVYKNNGCVNCHGADGKLGGQGAKDLSVTQLSADAQKEIVRNGKATMQGYKDVLTEEQIDQVIQYVATLKQQ